MREKQYVIVPQSAEQSYLDRGYARSTESAEVLLGAANWGLLSAKEREVVVVEIDAEQHAQLNDTHPKKFRMYFGREVTWFDSVAVVGVRVLESGEYDVLIAREDIDSGPEWCGKHDVFDTARECIADKRDFLLAKIAHMRNAADALEQFLKRTEAL